MNLKRGIEATRTMLMYALTPRPYNRINIFIPKFRESCEHFTSPIHVLHTYNVLQKTNRNARNRT